LTIGAGQTQGKEGSRALINAGKQAQPLGFAAGGRHGQGTGTTARAKH
jgi:hypothetical protein